MKTLSRTEARRIAVRAQLLDRPRPVDLLAVAERLTLLQLDPTAAIAPAADLVLWSRLGNAYQPEQLRRAVELDRTMFEHRGQPSPKEPVIVALRPMSDLGLYLAEMAALDQEFGRVRAWMQANAGFRDRVVERLRAAGPLGSADIPDTAETPWKSTGWTHERNVTQMLEFLTSRGVVAVSRRDGRNRIWDLAERIFPSDVEVLPLDEARRRRGERLLQALGVARAKFVGETGEEVEIEGTPGTWRVDPAASADGFTGRTALLSPFDRLIHDRKRSLELFDFDYTLEMYKPAAKRRWGYFALPVLHAEQMVGKVDAVADRDAGELRVNRIHEDVAFTKTVRTAVERELRDLATWLGLDAVRID